MGMNITELAQGLKAAAEKATPGRIGDRIDGSGSIKYQCLGNDGSLVLQTDHKNMEYGFIGPNSNADELFFRMCSPENIIALAGALEKAQRRIVELENYAEAEAIGADKAAEDCVYWMKRCKELEPRTVTVKQFDEFQICHYGATEDYAKGYIDCQNNFFKWLTAAGIKWEEA